MTGCGVLAIVRALMQHDSRDLADPLEVGGGEGATGSLSEHDRRTSPGRVEHDVVTQAHSPIWICVGRRRVWRIQAHHVRITESPTLQVEEGAEDFARRAPCREIVAELEPRPTENRSRFILGIAQASAVGTAPQQVIELLEVVIGVSIALWLRQYDRSSRDAKRYAGGSACGTPRDRVAADRFHAGC